MKTHKRRNWLYSAGLLGTLCVTSMAVSACVLPGEFDAVSNECLPPFFDAPTRDEFCSGQVDSRVVHQEEGFNTTSQPLIQVQGRFISILEHSQNTRTVNVRVLEETTTGLDYDEIFSQTFDINSGELLTSFAMMGLNNNTIDVSDATMALVYAQRELEFRPLLDALGNEPQPPDSGDDFAPEEDPGGLPEEPVENEPTQSGAEILTDQAREQFAQDCDVRSNRDEDRFPLLDIASMESVGNPQNNYLWVAMRCGMVVYGQNGTGSPQVVQQIPLKAQDVEIDRRGDRLLVAAGADGLKVRTLSAIEAELDSILTPESLASDESSGNDANNSDDVGEPSNDPDRDGFVDDPGVAGDLFDRLDPGSAALTNVVEAAFSRDRVAFINAPVLNSEDDEDRRWYLVSGEFGEGGLLQSRFSVVIDVLDDEQEAIDQEYQIVGLEDSLVAVFSKRLAVDGNGDQNQASNIRIYDMPAGKPPVLIQQIPLAARVNSIGFKDGELWTFHDDFISAYQVTINGNHLD